MHKDLDTLKIALAILVVWLIGAAVPVPWNLVILITFMLIGGGYGGLRLFMVWEHHRADIHMKMSQSLSLREGGKIGGYSTARQSGALLPAASGATLPLLERSHCPSFGELFVTGEIAAGKDFVLGFDERSEPIRMPTLTSLGIGGGQGSGKTVSTLVVMLEAITKYQGQVRFIVVDPHMFVDGEESLMSKIAPLTPFFLTVEDIRTTVPDDDHEYHHLLNRLSNLPNPTVGHAEEIKQWMRVIYYEMERRLTGKRGATWVVVIDEFSSIMLGAAGQSVALMLEKLNREARKFGMFAILVGQEWKATRTGGSELRHSIVSFIAHNMPEQISQLIVPSDVAKMTPKLAPGEAVIWNRGRAVRGQVPYASCEDAERIVGVYTAKGPGFYDRETVREIAAADTVVGEYTVLPGQGALDTVRLEYPALSPPVAHDRLPLDLDPEELRQVRELFLKGLEAPDIAKKVYGVRAGPELTESKIRVRAMLSVLVERGL